MRLIKELIHRRIPHIIGSYLIAGTSLILFVDWLVNRYTLPEYYTTLCLFGVIAIMPSVVILTYFHGAPGKDEWTRIEKIGVPVNIIFIFLVLLIGHRSNWWVEVLPAIEDNNNYYINVTSSREYIKYYNNNDSPFDKSYSSSDYLIESLHDTLIDQIKHSVFRSVSSEYANQGINIDVSFTKEENEAYDNLYHPILFELTDSQKDTLSARIDGIINLLDKNYINYDGQLPNTIIRYFIYQITDLKNKETFYTYQTTSHWGESVRTHTSTEYTGWSKRNDFSSQGIKSLIDEISISAKNKIYQRRYSGGIVGEVIEELDHDMVRIKQYYPGSIKKKMRLKSMREYVWAQHGLDIMIEDYMIYVDYMKNTDIKQIWEYGKSDSLGVWGSKLNNFDEVAYEEEIDKGILDILQEIDLLRDKDTVGGYYEKTVGINTDQHQYYLEVTTVEDSIVIAKITGSRHPVYSVRKGDWIIISK